MALYRDWGRFGDKENKNPVQTIEELGIECDKEFQYHIKNGWGNWKYDKKYQGLEFVPNEYFVRLPDVISSATLLDWIYQVGQKLWVTPDDLADFLTALEDLVGNVQGKLCPSCLGGSSYGRQFNLRDRLVNEVNKGQRRRRNDNSKHPGFS